MAIVADWRTMTGVRWTTPRAYAVVCVEAYADLDPAGDNGIDRVEFSVVVNGGAPSVTTVSSRSLVFPNHSAYPSPLRSASEIPEGPSDAGLKMAGVKGYGFKVPLLTVGFGTIVVSATVFTRSGASLALPRTITIYNDTDGGDRRPSTKRIYKSPTGNDANTGLDEMHPILTVSRGLELMAANPAGSSSADRDMGGAELVFMPGTHYPDSASFPRHTSGDWWANFVFQLGAKIRREALDSSQFITLGGNGAGTKVRLRLLGADISGYGLALQNSSALLTEAWLDGGLWHSEYWTPTKSWSVRFLEEIGQGKAIGFTNVGANARPYVTCSTARGVSNGWSEIFIAQDVLVRDYLALAFETVDRGSGGGQICNALIERQRAYRDLTGRVRGFIAGAVCTVPVANQVRIDAAGPLTFSSEGAFAPMTLQTLTEIAGSTAFQVNLNGNFQATGWPPGLMPLGVSPGKYGQWTVLSAGTNGSGNGYVILSVPGAVANATYQGTTLSNARIETCYVSGVTDLFHPDIIFFTNSGTLLQTGAMVTNVCCRDIDSSQGLFTGQGTGLTRSVIAQFRDGGPTVLAHNLADGAKTDLMIYGCVFNGNFQFGNTQTRVRGYDNVLNNASGIVGGIWDYNHFIAGSTFGTHTSTGAWFQFNPLADPWIYQPLASRFDTASGLLPFVTEQRWLGSIGTTRGVDMIVGFPNWDTTSATDITGTASGTVDVTGTATAETNIVGTASGIVTVTGAAIGTLSNVGLAAGTVDVTGSATGMVGAVGGATGTVNVTGAATGDVGTVGTAAGTVDVTGAAIGFVAIVGTADGTVDVTGTAFGDLPGAEVTGTADGTVDVTGAATGLVGVLGVASGTVDVTGSALAEQDIVGEAAGVVDVTGRGFALVDSTPEPEPEPIVSTAAPRAVRIVPWRVPRAARPSRVWRG